MSEEVIKAPESGAEPVRTIEVITAEIVTIKRQAQQIALYIAIELGRRLTEAKELLDHGQWGPWLEKSVEFSQDTAGRYMKLFREYSDSQGSLFGAEVNSATLRNLSVSKALALLAVPEEEREAFVVEHNVDELSTRQTDELIEEYKRKLQEAEGARAADHAALDIVNDKLDAMTGERDKLARQVKELEARPVEVAVKEPDPAVVQAKVDAAVKEAMADEKAKAKDLRAKLKAAEERADALAKEAEDVKSKATEAAEALAERDRLREQLRAQEKKNAMSDANVARFGVLFQQSQDVMNKMVAEMAAVADADTAARLRQAAAEMLRRFMKLVDAA